MTLSHIFFGFLGFGHRQSLTATIRNLCQYMADRRQCHRLHDMDDFLLRDMGLTRLDAEKIALGQVIHRPKTQNHR